jgi:hypothetical protein
MEADLEYTAGQFHNVEALGGAWRDIEAGGADETDGSWSTP